MDWVPVNDYPQADPRTSGLIGMAQFYSKS
jgi:hypothetical protein